MKRSVKRAPGPALVSRGQAGSPGTQTPGVEPARPASGAGAWLEFALLEHRAPDGTHWDLLLEMPGRERLATWRLAANPAVAAGPIAAEPIQPHRRVYLEYEGPLSGGRGTVRRVDRGRYLLEKSEPDALIGRFAGERLAGRWRVGPWEGRSVMTPA